MPTIPKPEHELARPRARKGKDQQATLVGVRKSVTWNVPADEDWHPIAIQIYESARSSGQADYWQDSDWAVFYSICEDISYYKQDKTSVYVDKKSGEVKEYEKPRSGQMLASIMGSLTTLLLTEGDRRKVRMELQEPPKAPPTLAAVAENVLYPEAFGTPAV